MTDSVKEIAGEIASLIAQLEDKSPDLTGEILNLNSTGEQGVMWSLQIEDSVVKIVIDFENDILFFDKYDLEKMKKAMDFFESFEPEKRKMIMAVLEYDEE